MKTVTKTKVVEYQVYIAKDGREFSDPDACTDYEKLLNGERKKCSKCGGTGHINYRTYKSLNELTYQMEDVETSDVCPECKGKGYLEKVTKWE